MYELRTTPFSASNNTLKQKNLKIPTQVRKKLENVEMLLLVDTNNWKC